MNLVFHQQYKELQNDPDVQKKIRGLDKLLQENRWLGKSPLHLRERNIVGFYGWESPKAANYRKLTLEEIKERVGLEENPTLPQKVFFLLMAATEWSTFSGSHFQCRVGASRSANDLYRLYQYYFPEDNIELIDVMRALHQLALDDLIAGHYCWTTKKMVFWEDDGDVIDKEYYGELKIPFREWNTLYREGVNYG